MELHISNNTATLLQEKPYDKDDDVLKATAFEVISTLRDVLKSSSLWRDHVQTYIQVFNILYMLILTTFHDTDC